MTLLLCLKLAGMLILFAVLIQLNIWMVDPPLRYVLSFAIGVATGQMMFRTWLSEHRR